jgi:hypothetical protein
VSATCVPDAATLDHEWASEQEALLAFWDEVAPAAAGEASASVSRWPQSMEGLGLNPSSRADREKYDSYLADWWEPKSMEELGLSNSLADCERYDSYLMGLAEDQIDYEIAVDDAAIAKTDIEDGWLESMAEEEAMVEHAVAVGDITEEAGKVWIDEIDDKVARFRVERGYDPPPLRQLGGDLAGVLRTCAVHAQRGTTRASRGRRARSTSASRAGPLPSSDDDDPDPDRLTGPREREVVA